MKDALGNDLVMGRTYGYSSTSSGVTTIKVGELVAMNTRVSLRLVYVAKAVYDNDPEFDKYSTKKTVSTKGNMLFPVDDKLVTHNV